MDKKGKCSRKGEKTFKKAGHIERERILESLARK
jgi:hypothetical protein